MIKEPKERRLLSTEEVEALKALAAVAPTLQELATAWKGATWFVKALKLIGALAAAVTAILALLHLPGFLEK